MKKSNNLFIWSSQMIFLIVLWANLITVAVAQNKMSPISITGYNYVLNDRPTYSSGTLYESTTGTNVQNPVILTT